MVLGIIGLRCGGFQNYIVKGFNVTGLRHLEPLWQLAIIQITCDKLFPFDLWAYRVIGLWSNNGYGVRGYDVMLLEVMGLQF